MDPDYAVTEGAKKGAKEREFKEVSSMIQTAKVIIEKEFNNELKIREAQLKDIQNKLTKVSKTLHVLRYVLIKSCYEKEDLVLQKGSDDLKILDAQNRIHPAVKQLLGNMAPGNLENSKRKRLRKSDSIHVVKKDSLDSTLKEAPSIKENSVIKTETFSHNNISDEDIVPIRNRPMVKKRVVVGNISKWMPSEDPQDSSTHKWMVYVRGPKDSPDISDFVQKVVFHLHPSYKPHDVIELKEAPFHLSRRGWGEFPLRVRIFFCNTLNKPVDVIHNLKLDKTHTGLQTLGNETVVEVTMYGNKALEVPLVKPLEETIVSPTENEVLSMNDLREKIMRIALLDHSYALKTDQENKSDESLNVSNISEDNTSPIKGNEANSTQSSPKKIKLENGYLSMNKNSSTDFNKYKICFPSSNFKLTVQALPYLLKRLPLVSEMASDDNFKCTYPFVGKSKEEFESWSMEKRISSEWSRAESIKKLISQTELEDKNEWTTKKILLYARTNGYSEVGDLELSLDNNSEEFYNESEEIVDVLDLPNEKHVKNVLEHEINSDVFKFKKLI